jgi:porin
MLGKTQRTKAQTAGRKGFLVMTCKIAEALLTFKVAACIIAGLALPSAAMAQSGTDETARVDTPKALTWDFSLSADAQSTFGGPYHAQGVAGVALGSVLVDGGAFGLANFSANLALGVYAGPGISEKIGSVQSVTAYGAPRMVRPLNAWVKWENAHVGLKAGIIDSGADFDEQNVGAMFLNDAHGMGMDISVGGLDGLGHTPYSALGAVAYLKDEPRGLKLRLGVFAGQSLDEDRPRALVWRAGGDVGHMMVAEADWVHPGWRVAVGAWHHTGLLPTADGLGEVRGASGGFVTGEATLLGVPMNAPAPEGRHFHLDGWLRYGRSHGASAQVRDFQGGGVVAHGFRVNDAMGLGFARSSLPRLDAPATRRETVVELTYQHPIGGHIVVQPNFQWVEHPGADPTRRHANVFGMRLTLLP